MGAGVCRLRAANNERLVEDEDLGNTHGEVNDTHEEVEDNSVNNGSPRKDRNFYRWKPLEDEIKDHLITRPAADSLRKCSSMSTGIEMIPRPRPLPQTQNSGEPAFGLTGPQFSALVEMLNKRLGIRAVLYDMAWRELETCPKLASFLYRHPELQAYFLVQLKKRKSRVETVREMYSQWIEALLSIDSERTSEQQ